MTYRTVDVEVEVDIDLKDFDADDLIEELESRGIKIPEDDYEYENKCKDARILDLYEAYTLKQERFDNLLRDYFYETIGRVA